MYNKDVLNSLIDEFGLENAILYCKMESRKSQLMLEDSMRRGEIGSSEWEFEKDWWNENEKQLLTLKLNNNECVTTSRKQSKISIGDKTMVPLKIVR
jgi:hypothetical protein